MYVYLYVLYLYLFLTIQLNFLSFWLYVPVFLKFSKDFIGIVLVVKNRKRKNYTCHSSRGGCFGVFYDHFCLSLLLYVLVFLENCLIFSHEIFYRCCWYYCDYPLNKKVLRVCVTLQGANLGYVEPFLGYVTLFFGNCLMFSHEISLMYLSYTLMVTIQKHFFGVAIWRPFWLCFSVS